MSVKFSSTNEQGGLALHFKDLGAVDLSSELGLPSVLGIDNNSTIREEKSTGKGKKRDKSPAPQSPRGKDLLDKKKKSEENKMKRSSSDLSKKTSISNSLENSTKKEKKHKATGIIKHSHKKELTETDSPLNERAKEKLTKKEIQIQEAKMKLENIALPDPEELARKKQEFEALLSKGIDLERALKVVIQTSWSKILEMEGGMNEKSGVVRVLDVFVEKFLEKNETGKRLYFNCGLSVQVKALISMLAMVLLAISDYAKFSSGLLELSAKHEIYRVDIDAYQASAKILSETIPDVFGDNFDFFTIQEAQAAWYKCMMDISNLMLSAQEYSKLNHKNFLVHRKFSSKWKFSAMSISLENVFVFRDRKIQKLHSNIPFKAISDILEFDDMFATSTSFPTAFGFELFFVEQDSTCCLCFEKKEEAEECLRILESRINAHKRALLYAQSNDSYPSESSALIDG